MKYAWTPKFYASTGEGTPAEGYFLHSYEAGTNTPIDTYTDSTGNSSNTNPIELDARGECNVWLDSDKFYKFVLKDPDAATIWTLDQFATHNHHRLHELRRDMSWWRYIVRYFRKWMK